MDAANSFDLWASVLQAGTRFLAAEDSDYLFLARAEADVSLSADTARRLSALSSDDIVALLDRDERVEAVVDLGRVVDVPINDFASIRFVGIAPRLSHRLGTWTRRRKVQDGLWLVDFDVASAPKDHDAVRAKLERQVLEPWIAGRRSPIKLFAIDDEAHLIRSGAEHYKALTRVYDKLYQSAGIDIVPIIRRPIKIELAPGQRKKPPLADLLRILVTSLERIRSVQGDIYSTLAHEAAELENIRKNRASEHDEDTAARPARAVTAVVHRLEDATKTLDDIYKTLSSVSPEDNSDKLPNDPIQTAIETRERLEHTVSFVDSATWAKWRGVRSNPSAALGKYKRGRRIFAVRSSKRDLYPAFQFSENAEPLPVIEKILKAVPKEAQGWPLLSWFEAKNVLLNNRKPSEVLASDPTAVLDAAVRFYSRDD